MQLTDKKALSLISLAAAAALGVTLTMAVKHMEQWIAPWRYTEE